MRFLMFLSDALIPILVFYIVGFGILMKKNVYDDFLMGAKEGIQTVVGILPTLVGLMVAVGILRASGLLDFISTTYMGWTEHIGIPSELIPPCHCQNVFLLGGNRTAGGFIQGSRV